MTSVIRRKIPHIFIDGYPYFLTINIYMGTKVFTHPEYVIPLLDSLNYYRAKLRFLLQGYVVMPEHMHIAMQPEKARTISHFMRDFKEFTAKRIIRQAEAEGNKFLLSRFREGAARLNRSGYKVWQDDYWDSIITSTRGMQSILDYIHDNPVQAGLVADPRDYPYSSYQNYLEDSMYPLMRIDTYFP